MAGTVKLVVVGAGPAGLSVAADACFHELGEVHLLEKGASHNQTVLQYYPDDKRVDAAYKGQEAVCAGVLCFRDTTKAHFLEIADEMLKLSSARIRFGCNVDSIKRKPEGGFLVSTGDGDLFEATHVVIAIGRMGKPNRPDYFSKIPAAVRNLVQFDIRGLRPEGKDILVVGGGNSAIEFALSLAKKTKVTVSYRGDRFQRLNPMNLSLLEADEKAGRIQVKRSSNLEMVEDGGGKALVLFKDGKRIPFDHVIYAIGGSSPAAFLSGAGIDLDERGNPKLDEWGQTSVPDLYVAGELAVPQGKGSIIVSFNTGKRVVEGIMTKLGLSRKPEMVSLVGH
jgi:thioredoxin reductase (NADPH)